MKKGFKAKGYRQRQQFKRRRQRTKSPFYTWMLSVCAVLVIFAIVMTVVDIKLRPSISRASVAVAHRVATEALGQAVTYQLAQTADNAKLVKMDNGLGTKDVSVIRFNLEAITQLQTKATDRAEAALKDLSVQKIRLPIGHILGGSVLSVANVSVPLRLSLLGNAYSSISVDVKSVGVNQVVHILYLDIGAQVNVVAPFVTSPIDVHTRAPIAYIVMTGAVPNTYYSSGVSGASPNASKVVK